MKNTFRTIVMMIAVFSVGGYFLNQQAMAGTVGTTAIATIDPSCSLAAGAFNFGNLDTITDATGSAEITVTMANDANSNTNSVVAVLGFDWRDVAIPADIIMLAINTQFDNDNSASNGPHTGLTGSAQALITVAPGDTDNTFWIVLADLNGVDGPGFTGNVNQSIILDFACV